jgi:cytochrome c oxidase subunit 1
MNGSLEQPVLSGDRKREVRRAWGLTVVAMAIAFAVFFIMAAVGVVMRMNQGVWIKLAPDRFYSLMTMHGLLMTGGLFTAALFALWYVLVRRTGIRANSWGMSLALVAVVVGVGGIVIGTTIGGYAPGWYMLYPIPFLHPTWPSWSVGMVTSALLLIGVAWTMILLMILRSLGQRYGYANLLGWQYLVRRDPQTQISPIVLISTICVIDGLIAMASGATFLIQYLIEWINPLVHYNALLEKNLIFIFGHTFTNLTLYLMVGVIYEMMPRFTGRAWKSNRVVVVAWNTTMVFILLAYFHHLYMDFAQSESLQYIGEIFSYASAIPATVVTVFGVIAQIYRLGVKRWKFVPATFALGTLGWIIGGFAAIIDATITNNVVFHNTLWVPAHFHTYYLEGVFLWLLGFAFYIVGSRAERMGKAALALMVVAGYGFLSMFYLGGEWSVPRRYSDYISTGFANHVLAVRGALTAEVGAVLGAIFIVGFLMFLFSLGFVRKGRLAELDAPEDDTTSLMGSVS